MKKVLAFLLVFSLVPCVNIAYASEIKNVDAEQIMASQDADAFVDWAAAEMRKRYEERGYTEITRPSTFKEVCDALGISSDVRELAMTDIQNAPADMREDILSARRDIIFSADGWYADKAGIYIVWFDDDTREWSELPKFSELFPGWDLPTDPVYDTGEVIDVDSEVPASATTITEKLFEGVVPVDKPEEGVITPSFYTWNLSRHAYTFKATVKVLTNTLSCNLGLTDLAVTPNVSLYYDTGLRVNQGLEGYVYGGNNPKLGFRASTHSYPGTVCILIEASR